MTVSSTNTKQSYSGDGNTTVFTYNFPINSQAELTVINRSSLGVETIKTLNSDYTIIDNGASGGSVTFSTAPGSTETVVLIRDTLQTQTTDYIASDPFPAEAHESALDKLTLQMQEVQEEVDRSLKLSRTNTMSSTEFTNDATDRALKVFAFDSSGDLSIAQELGSFKGNWASGTAYKQRDIVKDTSTNNVFFVNSNHTSSGSQPLTSNANSAKYDLIVDAAAATTSATNAATSETNASNSASAASTSETNAASSATAANTSATNAATSETNAGSSATAASSSQSAAATSATNASTSETNAATSASTATTQASTATTQAGTATTQATNASNSASAASTSESNAASSATAASNSASAASTSASNAATSETNSASSASTASTAATNAANAQAAAEAVLDTFDDKFLGNKTSDPSVDNDGNALTDGALYFDTTNNLMKVYDLGTTAWLQLTPSSSDQTNINAAVSNASNITTVAGIAADVTAVAGNSTNINAVNSNSSNINTVAGNDANITTVANADSNITAVASNASNINTVGAAITNVNNVGGSIANVNTVASNLASVNTFGEQYRIGTSDPTTSLDEGDLFYNSTNNTLKIYDGTGWVAGVTAGSGFLPLTGGALTGDLTLADDVKAKFGTGNDLVIYHHNNGSSYIQEVGSGDLNVLATDFRVMNASGTENKILATSDGGVELFHNNIKKAEITSTGATISGQVLATGGSPSAPTYAFDNDSNTGMTRPTSDTLTFVTNGSERIRLNSTGLGIGTTSPQSKLQVGTSNGTYSHFGGIGATNTHYTGISLGYTEGANANYRKTAIVQEQIGDGNARGHLHFLVDNTADGNSAVLSDSKMMIHGTSGDVIVKGSNADLTFASTGNNITFGRNADNYISAIGGTSSNLVLHGQNRLVLQTADTERLRVNNAGTMLIGKTSSSFSNEGIEFRSGGTAIFGKNGGETLNLNRIGSDGGILNFRKDNTVVGNVGASSSDFVFTSAVQDKDIIFKGNDGGSTITALTLDMSEGGSATFNKDVLLSDNSALRLGNGQDLALFHDGNDSVIRDNGTGALEIRATDFRLNNSANSKNMIKAFDSDRVELYYDNNLRLQTTTGGISVTGGITLTGTVDGRDVASDGSKLDGIATGATNVTNNNQLTNGAGYITSNGLSNLSNNGNNLSGDFTATGNVTAYSDERLKDNIVTIDNALDKVSQMRGVTFTKDDKLSSGVIAQELEKIAPELVHDGEYKSVAYGNVVGYLIEAIKELKQEIKQLKEEK